MRRLVPPVGAFCAVVLSLIGPASAQDPVADSCDASDFVFVIDDSYSFGDARAQREAFVAGFRAFVGELGEQHRIALVSFGDGATTLVEPVSNTPEAREAFVAGIGRMRFRDPWTDVYAGIDQAYRWARHDLSRRGVVIVVSDGAISLPDPDRPHSRAESERAKELQLDNIRARLPDVSENGVSIHTIAYVNDNTDYALMEEIAEKTGGIYQIGDTRTLPDIMRGVATEICRRDAAAARAKAPAPAPPAPAVATPTAPPAAPTMAPAPAAVAPAPIAAGAAPPPPVGGSPLLWFALAGGGLAVLGGAFAVSRRGRRRPALAAAGSTAYDADATVVGQGLNAIAAAAAASVPDDDDDDEARAAARRRRSQHRGPAASGPDAGFFTARRGTVTMAAVPEPPAGESDAEGRGRGGDADDGSRDRGARPGAATGAAAGAAASAAAGRGAKGRPAGGPPPRDRWHEDHMVRVVGFTTGGKVIKEVDFRRSGDTITVLGTRAGAILDVPADKGGVHGSVRYDVMPDGTRIISIADLPPGGFRDRDTGRALREGERLVNNQRIEWVREERGRYFEIYLK